MARFRLISARTVMKYSSTSGGSERRYSQMRSPVAPSSAWMTSRGLGMYMTPS